MAFALRIKCVCIWTIESSDYPATSQVIKVHLILLEATVEFLWVGWGVVGVVCIVIFMTNLQLRLRLRLRCSWAVLVTIVLIVITYQILNVYSNVRWSQITLLRSFCRQHWTIGSVLLGPGRAVRNKTCLGVFSLGIKYNTIHSSVTTFRWGEVTTWINPSLAAWVAFAHRL